MSLHAILRRRGAAWLAAIAMGVLVAAIIAQQRYRAHAATQTQPAASTRAVEAGASGIRPPAPPASASSASARPSPPADAPPPAAVPASPRAAPAPAGIPRASLTLLDAQPRTPSLGAAMSLLVDELAHEENADPPSADTQRRRALTTQPLDQAATDALVAALAMAPAQLDATAAAHLQIVSAECRAGTCLLLGVADGVVAQRGVNDAMTGQPPLDFEAFLRVIEGFVGAQVPGFRTETEQSSWDNQHGYMM